MDIIMTVVAAIASGLAWGAVGLIAYFMFFSYVSGSWPDSPTQVYIMASIIGFVLSICVIINERRP